MASSTSDAGPSPTEAPITQPRGKGEKQRAAAEDRPALQRRATEQDNSGRRAHHVMLGLRLRPSPCPIVLQLISPDRVRLIQAAELAADRERSA